MSKLYLFDKSVVIVIVIIMRSIYYISSLSWFKLNLIFIIWFSAEDWF